MWCCRDRREGGDIAVVWCGAAVEGGGVIEVCMAVFTQL